MTRLMFVVVAGLVLLHQDFWLWKDHRLFLGFLPVGLAYHMGYCVAASVAMWALVRVAWPAGLEDPPPVLPQDAAAGEGAA